MGVSPERLLVRPRKNTYGRRCDDGYRSPGWVGDFSERVEAGYALGFGRKLVRVSDSK
jgi:hypothetical protein